MYTKEELKKAIGLGVAGNFAGHLEQAGEASDFTNVTVKEKNAPKGLFPFYLPSAMNDFKGAFPITFNTLDLPLGQHNLQIEPEVALVCKIEYQDNKVVNLLPESFSAYNDCSIRKPGAKKISEKKNWGANSKGISENFIPINKFAKGGTMDSYRIASYLLRNNELFEYGIDSPVLGYSYFYEDLIAWIIEKMNTQIDDGPLESIFDCLEKSKFPERAIISIGATCYTSVGETTFLQKEDTAIVVVYDSTLYNPEKIKELMSNQDLNINQKGLSVLKQKVV